MRRLRFFVSLTSYLLAVTLTVMVGVRITRQMTTAETPRVPPASAEFRAYQEAKAEDRRDDWNMILRLAQGDVESWTPEDQSAMIARMMVWLDEQANFDPYFRRLSKEQVERMQTSVVELTKVWLEQRVLEYAKANSSEKQRIIKQDQMRVIGLALMLGRLGGPFGRGLNRGLDALEGIKEEVTATDWFFSPRKQRYAAYFTDMMNAINEWIKNGGWQQFLDNRTQY